MLVNQILYSLKDLSEESRIEFYKTSHPTSMKILGVSAQNKKKVIKQLKKDTENMSLYEKLSIAKELVHTDIFECQHVAYEFIGTSKTLQKSLTEKDIDELIVTIDNWVTVDCLGVYIVGPAWRMGNISTTKVKSYIKSDNQFVRRLAIVATVALNLKSQGGTGDVERTLELCELVVKDHDNMVVKATSWALRELSKRNKEPVAQFIKKHQNQLHKKVIREVNNKLNIGKKN